ncbi:MarR family transcriptional regulator [Paenibacillus sambharensis]|uniref:MarR family transcriptional regulator n=1 Tax=Paenibacillus sambharensis TaxID=1803190 RepID=A0A2W1L7U7_9BACL|nr:MarR family transcriptional regulator [Paenibacillus sambharensis]PZD95033.1 MarR family transcriptional regulator [Paenibacillus sambharensis]
MQQPPKTIGFEVKVLATLMKRSFEHDTANTEVDGLTGMQGWIIGYLHMNEGRPVFQRDLEREFNIRRATVTGVLKLMERDGLITREPVDYDARLKKLTLTPKAVELHKRIVERYTAFEKRLRSGLTAEEVETFFTIVDKIKQNIE